MNHALGSAIAVCLLAGAAPAAADASDPTDAHRWHLPRKGARELAQEVAGPVHAEWNRVGHLANDGKARLGDWGLRFDTDLTFFSQHASRVGTGQRDFGTFSWRVMGDWQLFDLREGERLSPLGRGFLGFTTFGTAGLNFDKDDESPTASVGTVNVLNATIFDEGAAVDELFWKQVALDGKLVVLAGKVDQAYHFDTNRVANDGYAQFSSYSLQNNPSIPARIGETSYEFPRSDSAMFWQLACRHQVEMSADRAFKLRFRSTPEYGSYGKSLREPAAGSAPHVTTRFPLVAY